MKTLAVFDWKDYDPSAERFVRCSSRAIIFRDNKIAMNYSQKYKVYFFPGGSIEKGETGTEALIRETREETGLIVKPGSIKEFGKVIEIRNDLKANGIFEQHDFYFFCDVEDSVSEKNFTKEETDHKFIFSFTSIEEAVQANEIEIQSGFKYMERETHILKILKEHIITD